MTVVLVIIAFFAPWLAILLAGSIVQGILAMVFWLIGLAIAIIPIIGWIIAPIIWLILFIWAVSVVVHRKEGKTNTLTPV